MTQCTIAILIGLVQLLALLSQVPSFSAEEITVNDVNVSLTTDKTVYLFGENITVTMILNNTGDEAIVMAHNHLGVFHGEVRKYMAEEPVYYYWPEYVLWVMVSDTLSPGQNFTFNHTFRANFEPGVYNITCYAYSNEYQSSLLIEVNTSSNDYSINNMGSVLIPVGDEFVAGIELDDGDLCAVTYVTNEQLLNMRVHYPNHGNRYWGQAGLQGSFWFVANESGFYFVGWENVGAETADLNYTIVNLGPAITDEPPPSHSHVWYAVAIGTLGLVVAIESLLLVRMAVRERAKRIEKQGDQKGS